MFWLSWFITAEFLFAIITILLILCGIIARFGKKYSFFFVENWIFNYFYCRIFY